MEAITSQFPLSGRGYDMPTSTIGAIARTCCHSTTALRSFSSSSHQSICDSLLSHYVSFHLAPRFARSLHFEYNPTRPAALVPSASPLFMAIAADGPPPGYRPNVGICLINNQGHIFVARRIDLPDSWQMPQGGVDENEEPRSAALRELQEETGVTSAEIIGEVAEWMTYDFPPDVKTKITQLWGREWNGQAQKWFLFRFSGDESEINLDADGIERAEFSEWKWASANEVLEKAVEFKKPVYEKALKAFGSIFDLKCDSGSISTQADTA